MEESKSFKRFLSRNLTLAVFLLLVILLFWYCGAFKLLNERPMGDHAWAQCDRASVARCYYEYDMNFFRPATHNHMYNPTGIAAGEFPLLPYLAALLYHIVGPHEVIYRLLVMLSALIATILGFLLCRRFIRNSIFALMASLLWLISPNFIYYSSGFLPESLALCMGLAAFLFLTASFPVLTWKSITGFVICASLAALNKSSMLMVIYPVLLPLLIVMFRSAENKRRFVISSLLLLIPLLFAGAWIAYAGYLQREYHSYIFLLKPKLPETAGELKIYLNNFRERSQQYYSLAFFLLSALLLIPSWVMAPKKYRFAGLAALLLFLSWIAFFTLMSRQAWHHGYYHYPFQIMFMLIFLGFFAGLERFRIRKTPVIIIALVFLVFASWQSVQCAREFRTLAFNHGLIHPDWGKAEPALEKMGVTRQHQIASYPDVSYNISLYLMNRRGWNLAPDYRDDTFYDALSDCDFLVTADTAILDRPVVKHFIAGPAGTFRGLTVYRLNQPQQ